uniref:Uncharacterized protein n=1 Tax=Anguilla anguilla TaxID=7936 RepID=A0A0E9VAY8_ANGAN
MMFDKLFKNGFVIVYKLTAMLVVFVK